MFDVLFVYIFVEIKKFFRKCVFNMKYFDLKKNCCMGLVFFFRLSVLVNEVFFFWDKDFFKEFLIIMDIRDLFWWMKYYRYRNFIIRVFVFNIV